MKAKLVFIAGLTASSLAYSCGDKEYEQCYSIDLGPLGTAKDCKCLPKADIGNIPGTPIPVPIPVPSGQGIPVPTPGQVQKEVEKGLKNISNETAKAVSDISSTIDKAFKDIESNLAKSSRDAEAEIQRAGKDTEEAVHAIGHYLEHSAQDAGTAVKDADKRIREGKVIDAVWHFGIAPLQSTEKNSGQALLESSVLRTVGQVAATSYGGPGGAAAYAAWLTYRETGDPSLAIRIGVIAGATNMAMSAAGSMPSDSAYELAKKAAVVGAIGGTAVAAAGGNEAAVKEAFLKAGAMVVIQDTFKSMTKHDLDGKASEGEPYCVSLGIANSAAPPSCAPPKEAYVRKPDGSLDLDSKGVPKIDMSKVDPARAAVGIKSADSAFGTENSASMKLISKVPGMQGMAVFHDQWAMKWNMDAFTTPTTIVPAVVLTYWGLGAPYSELLRKTAINSKKSEIRAISTAAGIPQSAPDTFKENHEAVPKSLVKKDDVVQSYLCASNQIYRLIAVERPREKTHFACRVAYAVDGSESFPWSAKSDGDYCTSKARKFAEKFSNLGWTCSQSAMNRRQ